MSGRRPHEAASNFVGPLQLALSCVTDGVVSFLARGREAGGTRGLILNNNDPVILSGPERLLLHIAQWYEIVECKDDRGPWKVSTRAYQYHVTRADGTEIILFHWHPDGFSAIKQPHMHLGQSVLATDGVLSRHTHLPTGRIALEEVIQLLISEFDVVPKRSDWEEVLGRCLDNFVRYRSWS